MQKTQSEVLNEITEMYPNLSTETIKRIEFGMSRCRPIYINESDIKIVIWCFDKFRDQGYPKEESFEITIYSVSDYFRACRALSITEYEDSLECFNRDMKKYIVTGGKTVGGIVVTPDVIPFTADELEYSIDVEEFIDNDRLPSVLYIAVTRW